MKGFLTYLLFSPTGYVLHFCTMKQASYSLRTPRNYPENEGIWEVVWHDVFMPFDVVCGTDDLPPDDDNYEDFKKTHWHIRPRTVFRPHEFHDLSEFLKIPDAEYATLEEAINFCIEWRKNWLEKELVITFSGFSLGNDRHHLTQKPKIDWNRRTPVPHDQFLHQYPLTPDDAFNPEIE